METNIRPQQISLRIAGTRRRQGGFAPIVSVGVLAGNDNMDRVTIVSGNPTYVLKHTSSYILYLLIDRNVKAVDTDTNGVLSIAITIPTNLRLANNVSPYRLLREVYDAFRNYYMLPMEDGRYSFKDVDIVNDDVFRTLLANYPLEANRIPVIPMSETEKSGVLVLPENKLDLFFQNSQYIEFRKFKDIEIGTSGVSSPGLENLEIPRLVRYKIVVNGKPTNDELPDSPDERYTTNLDKTKYLNCTFSLEEVYDAPYYKLNKNGAEIVLKPEKGVIYCTIPEVEYSLDCEIPTQEGYNILVKLIEKGVRVYMGNKDITSVFKTNTPFKCKFSELDVLRLSSEPAVKDYVFNSDYKDDTVNRIRHFYIKIEKKKIVPPINGSNGGKSGHPTRTKGMNNVTGPRTDEHEMSYSPYPHPDVNPSGWHLKSLIVGVLIGFFIGAGAMYGYDYIVEQDRKAEQERIAAEKAEQERKAAEQAEQERKDAEQAEQERLAAEKAEQERLAAEKAEQERLAAEKAEKERKAAAEKAEKDRKAAAEKAEKDRKAAAEKAKNDSINKASLLTEITIFLKDKQGTQSEQESSAMITKAKGHKGWSTLSNEEKLAASVVIEGINHSQVKTLKKTQKQKVVNVVKNGFSTWEDLVEGRNQIVKIINEK